ncbi:MAG: DUF2807 domain-containing protein [Rikenellaceae bacterium]|jgi:hypothetical protein|nr:DUF2807 domain-containing protein [Rikenellaceae bacterium]
MKTRLFVLMLAALPLFAAAKETITPSGRTVSQKRVCPKAFTQVEISNVMTLILENGPECALRVETYENVLPLVESVISRNTLVVSIKGNTNFKGDAKIKVYLAMPELSKLTVSGACTVKTAGTMKCDGPLTLKLSGASTLTGDYKAGPIDVVLSGASTFKPSLVSGGAASIVSSGASDVNGSIQCGDLRLEASGASDMTLSGTCGALEVKCLGASDLSCYKLTSTSVRGHMSGASDGQFTTTGAAEVTASGAGSVTVKKPDGTTIRSK